MSRLRTGVCRETVCRIKVGVLVCLLSHSLLRLSSANQRPMRSSSPPRSLCSSSVALAARLAGPVADLSAHPAGLSLLRIAPLSWVTSAFLLFFSICSQRDRGPQGRTLMAASIYRSTYCLNVTSRHLLSPAASGTEPPSSSFPRIHKDRCDRRVSL